MRVVQVLPALWSGGVERGTVDSAIELAKRGHEAIVVSNGGPLVTHLEDAGVRHIQRPVHRKSPRSFGQIAPMRRLLRELAPDIVHVRSRMPAWITRLARQTLPAPERPALISTFHGMHSVSGYSAIMAKSDHIIAVSDCVRRYVLDNYRVHPDDLTTIQRGVDPAVFYPSVPDERWRQQLEADYPALAGKRIILMPGRLSRWKGQHAFLEAMARVFQREPDCHGLLVGGADPGKQHYEQELRTHARALGVEDQIHFLGPREDMANLYRRATIVCHLSSRPEPFGRTVTEALACGTPVVAYRRGGAAESLKACFPQGLVPPDDVNAVVDRLHHMLRHPPSIAPLPAPFHLESQVDATIAVYGQILARRATGRGP
ncbi:glycosyl transferase [Tamilnaduibacter salinus]|uniref:Glycosyl transferase n=2 Tax=Tamilnaduibacter salinus TaxID=1484056 RepID=A0A2A2I440_9GAMM|nr:glycosyl transferase [Tamilnaduibacter salinus]